MPQTWIQRVESYFEFQELQTNWKTEVLAGCTTFITMAYIVFVNPSILKDAGMPVASVTIATCLASAFACILMGIVARYPIALAPGMGLNAYFTYTVVKGMGVSWETALGAVFISGVTFLVLTAVGVRQWIVSCIPPELYSAVGAGIGLFLAFIGLRNTGIVRADPATLVTLGNLSDPNTALALFGILLIGSLEAWKVRGSILIGILGTTLLAAVTGLLGAAPESGGLSALSGTFMHLDIAGAVGIGLVDIVFVFLFVDMFDNIGTLVAISKKARLIGADGKIPRVNRILFTDAIATIGGSLLGTTTVVGYIESVAGVAAGGRTGVPSIVTGLLFLAAMFLAPVIGAVPSAATAPALIIVGGMMISSVKEVDWDDPRVGVPAFLTLITIPLTFSIANGLAFGITSYVLIRVIRGEGRQIPWGSYPLAAILLARFVYLGQG
ncbi:MAG: NCS2 family permease [Acidobacteriota bacterium]